MYVMYANCLQCGKSVHALHTVRKRFCCRDCATLYYERHPKQLSPQDTEYHQKQQEKKNKQQLKQEAIVEQINIDNELAEDSWRDAGIRYEAITNEAIIQENRETSRRSIIISGNGG
jgi:predicted  nucleic acid-binding Zn-ribbon protein